MKLRTFLLAGLLSVALPALAQHNHQHEKPIPSGSAAIRFLDATQFSTRTPGSSQEPVVTWKFIAVWNSTTPPTTFFWRPDGSRWMTAAVTRVRGFISQDKTPVYKKEVVDLKDIRRGDMIEIAPMAMGRDVMPAALKSKPAGMVYFQRKGGKAWETANPGNIHRIMNMTIQ